MDTCEAFLNAYRDLEEVLEKRYGQRAGIVQQYASGDGHKYYEELSLFREIRNLLSHHGKIAGQSAVMPSEASLQKLLEILEYAKNPPVALSVATPIESLYCAKESDTVSSTCAIMENRGFSHLPILEKNGSLKGVFSVGTLFTFTLKNPEKTTKDLKIADLWEYTPHYRHTTEKFAFTSPSSPAAELKRLFRHKGPGSRRVASVFVTSNGTEKGKVLGMITPWDLLKIEK